MKTIFLFLISLLITNSVVIPQSNQTDESPYPKFVPYAVEEKTTQANINIDIKDLGKEQPAKFLTIDRFADKYPSFTPYHYAANNPLLYIDINGDSIQVNAMPPQLQYDAISSVSRATGIPLYVTSTGMLAPTPTLTVFGKTVQLASAYGTPAGGSQEAASFLNYAMSNSTTVNVIGTNVLGSQAGGQLVRLNSSQIESFINGTPADLNRETMGYGIVFLHELTHTDLGQSYHNSSTPLVDPSSGTGTGFVVDYMNRIRAQLGPDYGQRTNYAALQGFGDYYIPFNSINGPTRITFPR